MADQAIHEMISAFAAGCMDQENYKQFKNYIRSGGELPEGELGELQNVVSLVPSILDLEKPDAELKEKVAKRLISLQDEIKKKIKEKKERLTNEFTGLTEESARHKTRDDDKPADHFATDIHRANFTHDEKKIADSKENETRVRKSDESKQYVKPKPQPIGFQTQTQFQKAQQLPQGTKPVNSKLYMGMWIGSSTLLVILIIFIFYFLKITAELETKVNTLTVQNNELRNQLLVANKFITDYSDFVDFFNYKDVKLVNLAGSELSLLSSGKLFISFEAREGLLKLNDLPSLSSDQAYQLWLVSRGQSYSLGLFLPKPGDKYLKIKNIPPVPENDVDLVRITNENKAGAEIPQGNTYLFGTFAGSTPQQRRR